MNKKAKNKIRATDFSDYLAKELKDPESKKLYDLYTSKLNAEYRKINKACVR